MSLILDALKRSEAERRGTDTAAQAAASPAARAIRASTAWRRLLLAGGIATAALAGGLFLFREPVEILPTETGEVPSPARRPAHAPEPTTSHRADAGTRAQVAGGGDGMRGDVAPGAPGPPPEEGTGMPAPGVSAPRRPVAVASKATSASAPAGRIGATRPDSSAAAAGTAASQAEVPGEIGPPQRFGRLPYETRQALGPLRLDVHVYDADPLRRFVMINGKTLGAGAELKPGLAVDEIVREGVVLTWKGRPFLLGTGD